MRALTLPVGGYAPRDTGHGSGLEAFRAAVVVGTDGAVEVPNAVSESPSRLR